jgi:hypothetical protein
MEAMHYIFSLELMNVTGHKRQSILCGKIFANERMKNQFE